MGNNVTKLLAGKRAVITGCNRGIGKAILQRFAENGCEEIFAVIRKENAQFSDYVKELAEQQGCAIHMVYADFSKNGGG